MLDLFTILSKGGIVLWYFQGTAQNFTSSVNALIKTVILQERGGTNHFAHDKLALKYKLDNEFELIFVVAFQNSLRLAYVDKFLDDIQIEFRNKYKDDLSVGKLMGNFSGFDTDFQRLLKNAENASKQEAKAPRPMRSFEESHKSKKSVASMIENKTDEKASKKKGKGSDNKENVEKPSPKPGAAIAKAPVTSSGQTMSNGQLDEATIQKNLERRFGKGKKTKSDKSPATKSEDRKKPKQQRIWDGQAGRGDVNLDHSNPMDNDPASLESDETPNAEELALVGKGRGDLRDMVEEDTEDEAPPPSPTTTSPPSGPPKDAGKAKTGSAFGFLGGLRGLVGSKTLTSEDVKPVLSQMRYHLIGKNVAADIAEKLCESVSTRLEGRVLGTFNTVAATVKAALNDACVQILSPRRRIDILRDAMEAKQQQRPYTIVFCGVNGVGKSTNLAKVAFWLVENGLRVLIAACDTFRAGAVEQLRTHARKINALHPAKDHGGDKVVQLYEKGYGKDAAGIAMEAIYHARGMRNDVVLIDTAGRMQDNEPLMRALAKLIKVNQPDLVLFVGEALVGNEAVDQLTKFNQALADHSNVDHPRLIDGILLTKFDTIDDKVGAAISMTYTTGQPIVFVGTGQTYIDLKNLNAKAVVQALLRG